MLKRFALILGLLSVVGFAFAQPYTLTINTTGQGSVTQNPLPDQPGDTYLDGTPVTLTAVPDPGW
ncbi:MAG: hypothetical protein ABFS28_12935, partial [Bacteroidota bacterium]